VEPTVHAEPPFLSSVSYRSDYNVYDVRESRWATMLRHFDLGSYEDVSAHADRILQRLRAGTMPCDGAWPAERVDDFDRWVRGGRLP
jgi:hypothetical protein